MTTEVVTNAVAEVVNVACRLSVHAAQRPEQTAIVEPAGRARDGARYRSVTYAELDAGSNRIASGLREIGVEPGMRVALLVRPGIDFVALVFGLLKSGAVAILIDPGMGRRNLVRCLSEAEPEGFIAIPVAHAVRALLRRRFRRTRFLVTAGRRWFWGGVTLDALRARGASDAIEITTRSDDPAAIIFTTGSTGPPKGVLYEHGNFDHQATQIQQHYGIEPGTVDVSGFPLFALFNTGMGGTTVFPDMDFTRPAHVDPQKIIAAVSDWQANQAFGSPALWNRVGQYCEQHQVRLPTLRRVLSAGAPVPGHVLRRMKSCLAPDAEVYTPYGATEALPVASISASEVLSETQQQTDRGAGVCVGRRFSGIRWKVIRIDDGPLTTIDDAKPLPAGEIGELIVEGPVVTRRYVTRVEANALAKIADGDAVWHRMGDVGYLDEQDRFWFCGRKSHRVQTRERTLFTIPCEAVFNTHPAVFRSALVGTGPPGDQRPMVFVEPHTADFPNSVADRARLCDELRELGQRFDHTREIREFHFRHALPVDIRHNAKIFREKLVP